MREPAKCWIFGDESGDMDSDRVFAIGVVGTRNPREVYKQLQNIRIRTNYTSEISYKSKDKRRLLCALRWMDWFFGGQEEVGVKILLKDKLLSNFETGYFKDNQFKAKDSSVAYCESYREVLKNFTPFKMDKKYFYYHQKSLNTLNVPSYLGGKIIGLGEEDCYSTSTQKKHKDGSFRGPSQLVQFADLMTSTYRGLYESLHQVEPINKEEPPNQKDWSKNILQLNLMYHLTDLRAKTLSRQNIYHPVYNRQIYEIWFWQKNA